jgi:hypothetical protein
VQYIIDHHMGALLQPPDFAFPRVVKMFYQTLQYVKATSTMSDHIIIDFDGYRQAITEEDIAAALGFASCHTPEDGLEDEVSETLDQMVASMCNGQFGKNETCTRRPYLPEKMLIIDHIFHRNLCQLGHNIERRGYFLHALYSVYTGAWFSPARIMMTTMLEAKRSINLGRFRGKKRKLPYPRFITTILRHMQYPFDAEEVIDQTAPIFGPRAWALSFQSITTHNRYREALGGDPEEEEAQSTDEGDEGAEEAPAPQPAPTTSRPRGHYAAQPGATSEVQDQYEELRAEVTIL